MQALRVGVIALLLGAAAATVSLPDCPETCGKIRIPYPFGIGTGCFREGFNLTCSKSSHPPKLFLGDGTIQVLSISLRESVVRINSNRFTFFANSDAPAASWYGLMADGPYTISATRNRFVAVGCNIFATIATYNWLLAAVDHVVRRSVPRPKQYIGFCSSMCIDNSNNYGVQGGVCSGISCCQIPITGAIKNFNVNITHLTTTLSDSAPAVMPSRAFVVEKNSYKFSPGDLNSSRQVWESRVIPAVLDWMIKDTSNTTGSCDIMDYLMYRERCRKRIKGGSCEMSKSLPNFACRSNNSQCYNSNDGDINFVTHGVGYRCNCSQGFQGNPYLAGGCEDIDECSARDVYGCHGTCVNLPGTYRCFCPEGTYAISTNSTSPPKIHKCIPISIPISKFSTGKILTGASISIGVVLLLLVITLLSQKLKVRRAKKLKESYFKQNKGLLLQQLISSNQDAADRVKIFTSEELEKATNSFDRTRILGFGGHGTVYKGILLDQRVVAIKKSNINVQTEIDQFINEVAILTQIDHRNIVKLFGCCLETEVPLLVYEFVSNGTLSQHLHAINGLSLSWDDRLRIAIETARALAYLHTAASFSVFHRDIKSANILLNDALTAKVSDFGASRSVPLDHTHINTVVQGTFGYLDPEYFHTQKLTDKSDVYSFGVILVELLTGQKAVPNNDVPNNIVPEGRNLAQHFLISLKDNCHPEILEARVVAEVGEAELESVANLAEMCLRLKGEERPTMKEVEVRLEALRGSKKLPQYTRDAQRLEYLPDLPMPRERSSGTTKMFNLDNEFLESVKFPR